MKIMRPCLYLAIVVGVVIMVAGCTNPQMGVQNDTAMTHYIRGIQYTAQHNYDDAIAEYTSAIALDPNLAYIDSRATSCYLKGDYNCALSDYIRITSINPDYVSAYASAARLYATQGKYQDAITYYTKAIQLRSSEYAWFEARGDAYRAVGNKGSSADDYRTALSIIDGGRTAGTSAYVEKTDLINKQREIEQKLKNLGL